MMGKFSFNTNEFAANVRRAAAAHKTQAREAMTEVGHFLKGETQLRTPVDEGNLTDDISTKVIPYGKSIATVIFVPSNAPSSEYAIPMHEGFYRLGPDSLLKQAKVNVSVGRKYITNAIDDNRRDITIIIRSKLAV